MKAKRPADSNLKRNFPARKITMGCTQPPQDERYHIQIPVPSLHHQWGRRRTHPTIFPQTNRFQKHRWSGDTQGSRWVGPPAEKNTWLRNTKCFILESVPTTGTRVLHLKSESKAVWKPPGRTAMSGDPFQTTATRLLSLPHPKALKWTTLILNRPIKSWIKTAIKKASCRAMPMKKCLKNWQNSF